MWRQWGVRRSGCGPGRRLGPRGCRTTSSRMNSARAALADRGDQILKGPNSRSSEGVTRGSPACIKSRPATSSGRSVSRPDCFSAKMHQQPAAFSASSWRSSFYPLVETQAYPIRMLVTPPVRRRAVRWFQRGGHARDLLRKRSLGLLLNTRLLNDFLQALRPFPRPRGRSSTNDGLLTVNEPRHAVLVGLWGRAGKSGRQ